MRIMKGYDLLFSIILLKIISNYTVEKYAIITEVLPLSINYNTHFSFNSFTHSSLNL